MQLAALYALILILSFNSAFAAASCEDAASESQVLYTQTVVDANTTCNTTGTMVSLITGTLEPFGTLGGSSTLGWDQKHIDGNWSFGGDPEEYAIVNGNWSFDAKRFQDTAVVSFEEDGTSSEINIEAHVDGSIRMSFYTTHNMTCTTIDACEDGEMARTECIVGFGDESASYS